MNNLNHRLSCCWWYWIQLWSI